MTLRYENGRPTGIDAVVVSTQHGENVSQEEVREAVLPFILHALPVGWTVPDNRIYINPTGRFVIGGPDGDAGLTGRKIIVDTYGGAAPHGGGAFSGKDPTKVDRSAAYASRYLAKNVVAAGLADKCLIQLAYAIGMPEPVAVYVDTQEPARWMKSLSARPCANGTSDTAGIRERLGLSKPIYARTAAYGHFGRAPEEDGGFGWERTDLADELARHFGARADAAE